MSYQLVDQRIHRVNGGIAAREIRDRDGHRYTARVYVSSNKNGMNVGYGAVERDDADVLSVGPESLRSRSYARAQDLAAAAPVLRDDLDFLFELAWDNDATTAP